MKNRSLSSSRLWLFLLSLLALALPAHRAAAQTTDTTTTDTTAMSVTTPSPDTEVPALRAERSRTYQNADGTYTIVAQPHEVNHKDQHGRWQKYYGKLGRSKRRGFAFASDANSLHAFLPAASDGWTRIEAGRQAIQFRPLGTTGAPAVADGIRFTVENAWTDTTLSYYVGPGKMKEEFTLYSASAPASFTYEVKLERLTAQRIEDYSVSLLNAKGEAALTIAAPWMQDAAGSHSTAITVTVTPTDTGFTYTLTPDAAWMQNAVYPVVIDPSTTRASYLDKAEQDNTYPSTVLRGVTPDTSAWGGDLAVGERLLPASSYPPVHAFRATLNYGTYPSDIGIPQDAIVTSATLNLNRHLDDPDSYGLSSDNANTMHLKAWDLPRFYSAGPPPHYGFTDPESGHYASDWNPLTWSNVATRRAANANGAASDYNLSTFGATNTAFGINVSTIVEAWAGRNGGSHYTGGTVLPAGWGENLPGQNIMLQDVNDQSTDAALARNVVVFQDGSLTINYTFPPATANQPFDAQIESRTVLGDPSTVSEPAHPLWVRPNDNVFLRATDGHGSLVHDEDTATWHGDTYTVHDPVSVQWTATGGSIANSPGVYMSPAPGNLWTAPSTSAPTPAAYTITMMVKDAGQFGPGSQDPLVTRTLIVVVSNDAPASGATWFTKHEPKAYSMTLGIHASPQYPTHPMLQVFTDPKHTQKWYAYDYRMFGDIPIPTTTAADSDPPTTYLDVDSLGADTTYYFRAVYTYNGVSWDVDAPPYKTTAVNVGSAIPDGSDVAKSFGLAAAPPTSNTDAEVTAMATTASVIRTDLNWGSSETEDYEAPNYDFDGTLQHSQAQVLHERQLISAIINHGLTPLIILDYGNDLYDRPRHTDPSLHSDPSGQFDALHPVPVYANGILVQAAHPFPTFSLSGEVPYNDKQMKAYGQWAKAAVAYYKNLFPNSKVIWEVWNEPGCSPRLYTTFFDTAVAYPPGRPCCHRHRPGHRPCPVGFPERRDDAHTGDQ